MGECLAKDNALWSKTKLSAVREMCEFYFAGREDSMIFSQKSESGTLWTAISQEVVVLQKRLRQTSGDANKDEQCS